MKGYIASYDKKNSAIVVVVSGGKTIAIHADEWKTEEYPPHSGCTVEFEQDEEGIVTNVVLVGEYNGPVGEAVKSKKIAGFLAIFLGFAGIHRFYLGNYLIGICQLALTAATMGMGAVWGLVDAVLIFSGKVDRDVKNRPLK